MDKAAGDVLVELLKTVPVHVYAQCVLYDFPEVTAKIRALSNV
jgi:hypothetical protein